MVTKILGGSIGETADKISVAVKRFVTTDNDRMKLQLELEKIFAEKAKVDSAEIIKELEAKERFIVAELQQGDTYTKRSRPMVVRWGLYMVIYNYAVVPSVSRFVTIWHDIGVEPFDLPHEFWWAWTGLIGSYMLGRTLEKSGAGNKITSFITGKK